MDEQLERLTRDGTIPQDAYRAMREAIEKVMEQSGRLHEPDPQAHYQAFAAGMALRAAGYAIRKTEPEA